jgi:hypothetical protein
VTCYEIRRLTETIQCRVLREVKCFNKKWLSYQVLNRLPRNFVAHNRIEDFVLFLLKEQSRAFVEHWSLCPDEIFVTCLYQRSISPIAGTENTCIR